MYACLGAQFLLLCLMGFLIGVRGNATKLASLQFGVIGATIANVVILCLLAFWLAAEPLR
jgi:hypothetical protein